MPLVRLRRLCKSALLPVLLMAVDFLPFESKDFRCFIVNLAFAIFSTPLINKKNYNDIKLIILRKGGVIIKAQACHSIQEARTGKYNPKRIVRLSICLIASA